MAPWEVVEIWQRASTGCNPGLWGWGPAPLEAGWQCLWHLVAVPRLSARHEACREGSYGGQLPSRYQPRGGPTW